MTFETLFYILLAVLLIAAVLIIWFGRAMCSGPSMMHENETQEPREWRPANWKPKEEKSK